MCNNVHTYFPINIFFTYVIMKDEIHRNVIYLLPN